MMNLSDLHVSVDKVAIPVDGYQLVSFFGGGCGGGVDPIVGRRGAVAGRQL